ncbi:acyclic terpene utilization AtuA family protein [Nitrobacter sp.]|uniref:acyclic terpene utilization AtuA family protein n=1 Tax=Nitrobacter sp. TaxID=29420 RepID=UPI0029CAAEDF|nr:acyclic terpene utilization AtuA family protein [Nitrobacter sp.]
MNGKTSIRIGGASGFWGDSVIALPQLLRDEALDFIIFDFLAEVTMSILARARETDPVLGYVPDFVTRLTPHLSTIAARGLRIVSNAGGINPVGCAKLLEERISAAGLSLRVGVVTGDDLLPRAEELRDSTEMFSGDAMPDQFLSLNAYLGAGPIAAALDDGADIVITGRCVDSAMVLGPCIHAFGWSATDYDRLSGGSLAGHILECGAQASGGLFTDWDIATGWDDIGYPIAQIDARGNFLVTKVLGTGGLISRGTVAEQLVYEIGDPRAYLLPDVSCDWADVTIEDVGPDQVWVSGAKGFPPPATLKASATWQDGYRVGAIWTIVGEQAVQKAEKIGEAVVKRVRRLLDHAGKPDFSEVSIEVLGSEISYGPYSRARGAREVILKIAAKHAERQPLSLLVSEFTSAGTSMAPGFTGFGGNRPKVASVVRLFSVEVPRTMPDIRVAIGATSRPVPLLPSDPAPRQEPVPTDCRDPLVTAAMREVPLHRLAWGRSGDKGNHANIGIIARRPEYLAYIRAGLNEAMVGERFGHYAPSAVERFDLPGIHAINFLLRDILGGGGIASLRNDPQGKGYAQILLSAPIAIPSEWRLADTEGQ